MDTEIRPSNPEEALAALANRYAHYCAVFSDTPRYETAREALGNLAAGRTNTGARGPLLDKLYEDLSTLVETLTTLLSAVPAQAEPLALRALDILLFYPQEKGQRQLNMSLASLEGLAAPLLAFLSPVALAALATRYKKRNPPRIMFPNQTELLRRMTAQTAD
ncbi:MAG: hypothetical protein LIO58_08415 [Oscillospiraceae bacterium]|nr:hypothetical protein [Oscillospiraceae bacterium]